MTFGIQKINARGNMATKHNPTIPALYCTRSRLVDQHGKLIGFSPLFNKKPCFQNALVQNIAGGNTMVFNKAALNILQKVEIIFL